MSRQANAAKLGRMSTPYVGVCATASGSEIPPAILVDVGSSRTKFAFAADGLLRRLGSVPSAADVAQVTRDILRLPLLQKASGRSDCVITSVKPELSNVLRDVLSPVVRGFFFLDFEHVPELELATLARYVAPDRLADIIAAVEGECPAIVVDIGTATTVDVIDAGRVHLGGAIMPGMLFTGQFCPAGHVEDQAQSILGGTVAARNAAAVCGHAGAIDRLCEMFAERVGPARIVATGGLAAWVVPACRSVITVDNDLTLRGTRQAHIRLCARGASELARKPRL